MIINLSTIYVQTNTSGNNNSNDSLLNIYYGPDAVLYVLYLLNSYSSLERSDIITIPTENSKLIFA